MGLELEEFFGGRRRRFVLSVSFGCFVINTWCSFNRGLILSQAVIHFSQDKIPYLVAPKEEGLAGDVPIREMLDSNAYSLSTQGEQV